MRVNPRKKTGKLFIICGPSGSGKTTLLTSLIKDKKISRLLSKSRSITTRPKRSGEREGKDYLFSGKQEFLRLLKEKKILEWTRYLGYYYGTPREPLEDKLKRGLNLGLCLDLKGARILKKLYPKNTVTVFVLPPSLSILKSRIRNRCHKTNEKEITQRIKLAADELKSASRFDYCILNKNLSVALQELKDIFLKEITKN